MNFLVWEMPDGSLRLTHISPRLAAELGESRALEFSAHEFLALPGNEGAVRCPDGVPSDLSFMASHSAYECCLALDIDKRLMIDPVKARARRMELLRDRRDSLLREADGPTLRESEHKAAGQPNQADQWLAYKEALRVLPNDLEAKRALASLSTLDEIAGFEPSWPIKP